MSRWVCYEVEVDRVVVKNYSTITFLRYSKLHHATCHHQIVHLLVRRSPPYVCVQEQLGRQSSGQCLYRIRVNGWICLALAMALKTLAHPFACIQVLWLKAKLIARVMSVTGLGKVVSDQNPLPCN